MAMRVKKVSTPPQRLEGGGFIIKDSACATREAPQCARNRDPRTIAPLLCASAVLSDFRATDVDPFLIWHELPRKHYMPGEMPGAPLHPHRGMCECPYAKEFSEVRRMRRHRIRIRFAARIREILRARSHRVDGRIPGPPRVG